MKRIFCVLLLLCSTMLIMAQEPGSEFNKNLVKSNVIQQVDNNYYYVHVIGAKQTLYSIAHLYGVSVSLICEINNIDSGDNISEGQTIYIPIVEEDVVVQE
ncbi:MAG: LysM peptidoglycan-binding domain-containing protein, partial [Bacteroidales bacterium]|nr:LysM peptidoglycan-binding domain-containing protein [Bacteroidales bacterium]